MPADTASAASVTDPVLLRYARAGADWRCIYCLGDQRRSDGRCANCGAASPFAAAPASVSSRALTLRGCLLWAILPPVLGLMAATCLVWLESRPHDYRGTVSAVTWEHVIEVDRYALRTHEGFRETLPKGALHIKSLGRRVHHEDTVVDHYTDQDYSVDVPDGYRSESYTVRETCGEDCTSIPETCREKCTSNKNGFATCRTVCTGGGKRCRPRYCNESRTRQVAKTRSETRTRQVPIVRFVKRYAEAFSYQTWEWAPERTVRDSGHDTLEMYWPAGARTTGLPAGEQERERRTSKYIVTLRYRDSDTLRFEVPDAARFALFKAGSVHQIYRIGGVMTVDGMTITRLP
jgi:hypothetical protein